LEATTDVLTGLQNRRAFEAWLAQPVRRDAHAALLLIDLNNFKPVNDVHGHGVGDDVLRQVGRIIGAYVRPGDLALRHGGDEFAVVLEQPGLLAESAVKRAVALRRRLLDHDWDAMAPGLSVGASIGVAVGALADGAPLLYRRADVALYAAKGCSDSVVLAGQALDTDARPGQCVGRTAGVGSVALTVAARPGTADGPESAKAGQAGLVPHPVPGTGRHRGCGQNQLPRPAQVLGSTRTLPTTPSWTACCARPTSASR